MLTLPLYSAAPEHGQQTKNRSHLLKAKPLAHTIKLICASVCLASPLVAPMAMAETPNVEQTQTRAFDIAPAPLNKVLNQLSAQAGIYLSGHGELTANKQSAGLTGQYNTQQALDKVLENSGLTAVQTAPNRYSLRKEGQAKAARGPETLQSIEVIGTYSNKSYAETSFATTKTETHILDIPQSVSTVTKEVIQEHNLMRLNDITPFVAGVNEFSVYDDLVIRGFRNGDDRRVNGLRTYNSYWTQSFIPHLERVEVIKGATAATFGDSSPGGVINMVTKKPLNETRREVTALVGSHNQKYIAADMTGALNESETVLYRLNAGIEDSESFRDMMFNESKTIAPSFSFIPSDDTRINLDIVYSDQKTRLDRGQPGIAGTGLLNTVPIETNLSQQGDRLDFDSLSAALSVEHQLSDNWTVVLAHMHSSYDEKLNEHRGTSYLTPSTLSLDYYDRDTSAKVDTTSVYLTGQFSTGAIDHKLLFGTDYVKRSDDSYNRSADDVGTFDLLNPSNGARDTASYTLEHATWGNSTESQAIYLQDQMMYGDWELLVGLRYDDFSQEGYDEGLILEEQSDSQISPRAGLVYKLDDSSSVYGSWVTGFEPAETWNNYPEYGGPFDPSESELLEVGYKQQLMDGDLLLTAALYQLTQTNVVVWVSDEPETYEQRGEERSRGLELEAIGQITPNLNIIANYSYTDAVVSKDSVAENVGKRKENAPEHTATLWGRYRLNPAWSVGAGLSYVGERTTWEEGLNLPAYTVYNAGLYYTNKDLEISLLGKNLTDKTHWTGGYESHRVFPGDPRAISLNLNYRF